MVDKSVKKNDSFKINKIVFWSWCMYIEPVIPKIFFGFLSFAMALAWYLSSNGWLTAAWAVCSVEELYCFPLVISVASITEENTCCFCWAKIWLLPRFTRGHGPHGVFFLSLTVRGHRLLLVVYNDTWWSSSVPTRPTMRPIIKNVMATLAEYKTTLPTLHLSLEVTS